MTSCHNISKKIPLGYYAKWDFLFTITYFTAPCLHFPARTRF